MEAYLKNLNELALFHGADKGSNGHGYARHYDVAFTPIRSTAKKVMEIGVGSAESMHMWLGYFYGAEVVGIDIVYDTNNWNSPQSKPHPRYTFVRGDQSSEQFWIEFVATHGPSWDILVDDGGHSSQQIITTFKMMWPHIKPGGFYAIEDLNCAYSGLPFFCPEGWQNHMDFVKDMLDQINRSQNDIDSLRFSNELCILQKKA